MSASSLWPPNSCAWCGELERAHGDVHDYSPPADALRLARMKARREARLNPPTRPAVPPDTIMTLTVNADDFTDALRYVGDHTRLFDEAAMHRLRTNPGVTREEAKQMAAGILALADRTNAEPDATY